MKSFSQFQEDASSQTQSAISGSGSGKGSSDADGPLIDRSFKKRPSTGLGRVAGAVGGAALRGAGRAAGAIKDRMGRPRPEKADKPVTSADRKPQTYRDARKTASPKPERAGALAKRPEKKSMVQQKTAASKQPPQHKQIDARPASTAMAGSRQRPAIRPGAEKKALPPSQQKRLEAQPNRPALPPGGFRAKDLRARG